jgi:putative NADH-flavin reductase
MRVAVIAGSGGIGRWLLAIAREDGDHVKTLVRDRRKLPGDLGAVGVIEGDVRDPAAVDAVVAGTDVVLSGLGSDGTGPSDTREIGTRNILESMKNRNVSRLLVVSSAGVEDDPNMNVLARRIFLPLFLRNPLADCRNMERLIVASETVWTIVRPGRLTDGPRTGLYRANERFVPEGGREISRADVADFMVRTIADERTIRKIAALCY